MKIATWNVERLKHHRHLDRMLQEVSNVDADILVLTETDSRFCPDYPYYYHTPFLQEIKINSYRNTENRVSIFSKFRCIKQYKTYDAYTAICVELETDQDSLLVYGTIMGIWGNREASFQRDLAKQMEDIQRLSELNKPICVVGDYNLSFHDNYYFTRAGRDLIMNSFHNCGLDLLTQRIPMCIDHIAITKGFIGETISIEEWNKDRILSDHKGIVVEGVNLAKPSSIPF